MAGRVGMGLLGETPGLAVQMTRLADLVLPHHFVRGFIFTGVREIVAHWGVEASCAVCARVAGDPAPTRKEWGPCESYSWM